MCKAARILEGKTFWLQMPFSATGFKPLTIIDRDGKELPLSFLAGGDSEGSVVPSMETADELSDEERRVLQKAGSQGKREMPRSKAFWGAVIQRLEKFSLDSWIKGY